MVKPRDGGTLTHREFKVLLDGSRFRRRESLQQLQAVVGSAVRGHAGVTFDPTPAIESHVRGIEFFDTAGAQLRASSRILRRRAFRDPAWPSSSCEVTYKVRSEDQELVAGQRLETSAQTPWRHQFKEEITGAPKRGHVRRLWSRNIVLDTPALTLPGEGAPVASALPDLGALGVGHGTPLVLVGGRLVTEVGALLGQVHFHQHTVAHSDVAIWRDGPDGEAFVAEAGFTYHVHQDRHPAGDEAADAFFLALLDALDEWRSAQPTKTAALYELAGTDQ